MAAPTITMLSSSQGPTNGGELVRVSGMNFAPNVAVLFGETPAEVLHVINNGVFCFVDVHTPKHYPAIVDVILKNLDNQGQIVPGEAALLSGAYSFQRPNLVAEADLTRLIRTLLWELKKQILANTNITVSVDYDDTPADGMDTVAIAKLPAIVLTGPGLSENRFYSVNTLRETEMETNFGAELVRYKPSLTMDLNFSLTVASEDTAELLNLMGAISTFFNRNPWLSMPRDPNAPGAEAVHWEMELAEDFRISLDSPDDVRAFTCGFVIRGFDVDEGQPLDIAKLVEDPNVATDPLDEETGGSH